MVNPGDGWSPRSGWSAAMVPKTEIRKGGNPVVQVIGMVGKSGNVVTLVVR